MRKAVCFIAAVVYLLAIVPATPIEARKKKKVEPPDEETETDWLFSDPAADDDVLTSGEYGFLLEKASKHPPHSFGARYGHTRRYIPWPIFCLADEDDDLELTRKEYEKFLKAENKGKADTPSGEDYAYSARSEGMKSFLERLAGDTDKDGALSFSELQLDESEREGFDRADLNGDGGLDVHEYPGWYAVGINVAEGDPLRSFMEEGSTWEYRVGMMKADRNDEDGMKDRWTVIHVGPNSARIEIKAYGRTGFRGEEYEPTYSYLRLWFCEGRKAWPYPGATLERSSEPETVDLPIGEVSAYRYERTAYNNTYWELHSSEYPGIPVAYKYDQIDAWLCEVDIKESRRKPKEEDVQDAIAEAAAKQAGVSIFILYDKNRDNRITAKEYLEGNKKYRDEKCKAGGNAIRPHVEPWISPLHFAFADKDDEDGLSREEFNEYRKRFERHGSFPAPHKITRADLDRMSMIVGEDQIDRYDTNGDGKITNADEIAGEGHSGYRENARSDLNGDGEVTKGELEENHRARVLRQTPDLERAEESDTGEHDWILEDKNLDFKLFKQPGREWTFRVAAAEGKTEVAVETKNRVLRADDEGALLHTRVYHDGELIVSMKVPIHFTPLNEAALKPPEGAVFDREEKAKAAGQRWKCKVYTMKTDDGTELEEWMCEEYPGLRIKSQAIKNGRKVTIELTEFDEGR